MSEPENTIVMTLETGPVTIELRPDLAPNHVARIKELAREGFYDGVVPPDGPFEQPPVAFVQAL